MKGRLAIWMLCAVLMLSACQNQSADSSTDSEHTTTVDSTDAETSEAIGVYTSDEQFELPGDLIRSNATVVDDSKTQSIITSQESYQIGTYIKISVYADMQAPDKLFDEIFYTIDFYEKMIAKNITTSEVDAINAAAGIEPVAVSDDLWMLIQQGLAYSALSDGKFDITIGPLVDLWGIGTDTAHIPDQTEIDAAVALINYHDIELDEANHSVYLKREGMKLDLGAIAKGYIADAIKQVILNRGYEHAIINLGGNVLTVGTKPNSDYWSVGVRDPNGGQSDIVGILKLRDNAIVSSGIYERFFIEDGVRYHHILNPYTGYPEQNHLASISIVSEKSVDGDGLSTSLFVMGLDEAYAYAETRDDIEVLFITDENKIYFTDGLADVFVPTNTLYEVVGAYKQ
ncbi:FAD:protein FMN transferase [Fusibacter paucivorans]|uniref:FAD:protein FMN transferase n=1 Tax=Fusibacter paucivorans TaxID=76009 RepID=A0ABS5PTC1_9FIRM|nr:FAD:protein FMN transferase [Fusibacter paucivorans]MBS7527297.1 FAD:protein FMN transferase [Fusibacter paucivorans]